MLMMMRGASLPRSAVRLLELAVLSLTWASSAMGFSLAASSTRSRGTSSSSHTPRWVGRFGTAPVQRQYLSIGQALCSPICFPAIRPGKGRRSHHNQRPLGSSRTTSAVSSSLSSNDELVPGISAIRGANADLHRMLEVVREQPYFRLYSVDILASCEYLPQELFECYTESCEIYPAEEGEVPDLIRSTDTSEHEFELDGWARWDMPSEDYYDTQVFPESYTGYDGAEVWRFIHNRICFEGYEYDDDHWKADFNKAVSGLHSMVSAQVVRGIQEKVMNGEPFGDTEVWRDPHVEFQRRLGLRGDTPLALENLFFAYMLILSAVAKARDRLLKDCASGKIDGEAAAALRPVLEHPLLDNPSVSVAYRKLHDHAVKDSDSVGALWEARMRSRELLRIMNCVQCNKCRLHGKISVMGLSTALQVLVGRTGEGGDPTRVHRVELAALMTALHKFSTAIKFCEEMMR